MATRVYVLDGGGPKDSENTHNSFLTKRDEDAFWQIGTDMRFALEHWFTLDNLPFVFARNESGSAWVRL